MVLAIPVYTMLRVVARNFLSEFKIVQRLTEKYFRRQYQCLKRTNMRPKILAILVEAMIFRLDVFLI